LSQGGVVSPGQYHRYSPGLPPCPTPKILRSFLASDYESRISAKGEAHISLGRSAAKAQVLLTRNPSQGCKPGS